MRALNVGKGRHIGLPLHCSATTKGSRKNNFAEIALGFRPDLFATIERIRRRSKAYAEDSRLRSGRR